MIELVGSAIANLVERSSRFTLPLLCLARLGMDWLPVQRMVLRWRATEPSP